MPLLKYLQANYTLIRCKVLLLQENQPLMNDPQFNQSILGVTTPQSSKASWCLKTAEIGWLI